ncbi:PREDICTED: UDP-glycosyltransferase 90A1-like [Prunus mume]|uniref:Glycosyltransferase n=1 Tax=Prunus mume TaxID=102107 RepID=A0ABM0NT49_PRUMU|nr:PREDICTED: UDP-glycosyltransferase 90A1-like [Prunus mume]
MATSSPPPPPPHAVIFPFMAQGHTIPLLDISKALSSRGLKVTVVTTLQNAPFISSKVSDCSSISISVVPFPSVPDLPRGCENTASLPSMELLVPFIAATKNMKQPFESLLKEMVGNGSRPICVISDFFLSWTLDTCRSFDIPRVVSHGMGLLPMVVLKTVSSMDVQREPTSVSGSVVELPDLSLPFTLDRSDLQPRSNDPEDDPFSRMIWEVEEADRNSWGVIVNSFQELECEYVAALEALHKQAKWLDEQDGSSAVIYASFGTQARLSGDQMDEIAYGLEMAGCRFIWAIRSGTWASDEGWERRVEGMGLVVCDWVDQRSILAHPKVAGFLSHCGWNSVLESLSMGVPLLAWPMGAEQPLNAQYVAIGLKAGLMVSQGQTTALDRYVICDGIEELMGGEKGRRARERAGLFGTMARHAVEKGGSSDKKLDELIKCLIANKKK